MSLTKALKNNDKPPNGRVPPTLPSPSTLHGSASGLCVPQAALSETVLALRTRVLHVTAQRNSGRAGPGARSRAARRTFARATRARDSRRRRRCCRVSGQQGASACARATQAPVRATSDAVHPHVARAVDTHSHTQESGTPRSQARSRAGGWSG
jgi:hypothetical protein